MSHNHGRKTDCKEPTLKCATNVTPTFAPDGALWLASAAAGKVTDVVMPGMNGRKLAEQARQRRPALKVLFMTGYSRNAIVHQGRLDAGVELIQKPLDSKQLATTVRRILDT